LTEEQLQELKKIYAQELGVNENVVIQYNYHKHASDLPIAYELRPISHDIVRGIIDYDGKMVEWGYFEKVSEEKYERKEVEVPWIEFCNVFKLVELDKKRHRISWFGFLGNAVKSWYLERMFKSSAGEIIERFKELSRGWDLKIEWSFSEIRKKLNEDLLVKEALKEGVDFRQRGLVLNYIKREVESKGLVCPICGAKLRVGSKVDLKSILLTGKVGNFYTFEW
jgi:hypothetical protein